MLASPCEAATISGVMPAAFADSTDTPVSSIRRTLSQSLLKAATTTAISLGEAGEVTSKSDVKQSPMTAVLCVLTTGNAA